MIGSFDRAATALALSARLQVELVPAPQTYAGARAPLSAAYEWPELVALWPASVR